MFINKVSFSSIKQNFSAKFEQVGSFCGRKVEQFKACASPKLARIQSIASNALSMISTKMRSAKKALVATKDYIVSKASELAARIFKKAKAPAAPAFQAGEIVVAAAPAPAAPAFQAGEIVVAAAHAPAAEEAPAPAAPAAPAAPQAPAPAAPAAPQAATRSGRKINKPARLGFNN